MNELGLEKSNKIMSFNNFLLFALTFVVGLFLTFLGTWLDFILNEEHYEIYYNVAIALVTSALIGYTIRSLVKKIKLRSKRNVIIFAALAMILVMYIRLILMSLLPINEGNIFSIDFYIVACNFLFHPIHVFKVLMYISENIFSGDLQNMLLFCLWIIESILIIIISIFMGVKNVNHPFDEVANDWIVPISFEVNLVPFNKKSRAQILEAIKRHDISFFRNLMTSPYQNYYHYSKIYFYKNSDDRNSGFIEIKTLASYNNDRRSIVVLSPYNAGVSFANDLENEFIKFEFDLSSEDD